MLRDWLGVTREVFYDPKRIALLPTGSCYPGTLNGADLPPRPECAPLWHVRLLASMPAIRLILLVGDWAQRHHLGTRASVAVTVAAWREHLPRLVPLLHPSWRNRSWTARHPWFEAEGSCPRCVRRCSGRWRAQLVNVNLTGRACQTVSRPDALAGDGVSADVTGCTAASP